MLDPRYYCSLLLLTLIAAGCGDGSVKLPTASVSGSVTYRGKPLGGGRIVFYHPSGQAKAADLGGDGTFKMTAFQGQNQASVQCYEAETPGAAPIGVPPGMKPVKSLIPQRYTEFGTSELTFDVKPGGDNNATFQLSE